MGSVYLICIVNVQGAIKPPLFGKEDFMEAGGRATYGVVAEGVGELLDKSASIPLLQRGR